MTTTFIITIVTVISFINIHLHTNSNVLPLIALNGWKMSICEVSVCTFFNVYIVRNCLAINVFLKISNNP